MRCCGSPTTFTAAEARGVAAARTGEIAARDVVGAVLFREILKPLANGLGPLAEITLGAVADELFVRPRR